MQPGQKVVEYDDLVEVFTDKLVAKIPSTADGVVKAISYEIDDVCLVGHSLLTIEVEDGSEAAETPTTPSSSPTPAEPVQQSTASSQAPDQSHQ